jgi:hypothetical protein
MVLVYSTDSNFSHRLRSCIVTNRIEYSLFFNSLTMMSSPFYQNKCPTWLLISLDLNESMNCFCSLILPIATTFEQFQTEHISLTFRGALCVKQFQNYCLSYPKDQIYEMIKKQYISKLKVKKI